MHKAIALGVVAALGLGTQAFAANMGEGNGLSYDYLEANYDTADYDGLSGSNPDGFGLKGSIGFTPMVHGYVDYDRLTTHGFTIQGVEIGAGLNHSLTSNLDLIGRLGYARAKVEGFGSDDGFGAQAGIRARFATDFEAEALVHYTDFDDAGDNTSLKLAGRWFFTPQFALGAGVELDNDVKLWNVGFRWNFK